MKTLNLFPRKQIISPVIHYLGICSVTGTPAVLSWYNMDLCHPGGKLSNVCSCGSEVISEGYRRWLILLKRRFPIYDPSVNGWIKKHILGVFLFFNSAIGLFCIDIIPEEVARPDAELISIGSGAIEMARNSVKLQKTSAYRVPFILRRNLILIEAMVDDKKGLLLLDSGMDHVVLNQKYFKGESYGQTIIGVMDDRAYPQRKYVSMKIGHLPSHTQNSYLSDLNHLEQIFHVEILGICGVEFLQQFQWVIHYPQRFIDFYPLGKSGDVLDHSLSPPNEVIPLQKEAHLLIIKVRSEGNEMYFALDTGTNSTILDKKIKASLIAQHGSLVQLQHTSKVTGITGKSKINTSFALYNLRVGSTVIPPIQVSFVPLTRIKRVGNIHLDGIFNPIFMCHNTIGINWKKKRLYVWKYLPEFQESVAESLDQ